MAQNKHHEAFWNYDDGVREMVPLLTCITRKFLIIEIMNEFYLYEETVASLLAATILKIRRANW